MEVEYHVKGKVERADHAWISNGAFSMVQRVRAAEKADDKQGITYLCMSALLLIAFSNEAHINLVGAHVFSDAWPESLRTTEKLALLAFELKLDGKEFMDTTSTTKELMKFRNDLAHPKHRKPKSIDETFKNKPTDTELDKLTTPPLLQRIDCAEVERQYSAMESLFKLLCEASEIDLAEYDPHSSLEISQRARPAPKHT